MYYIYRDTNLNQEKHRKLRGTKPGISDEEIQQLAEAPNKREELFHAMLPFVSRLARKKMARAKMISPSAQLEDLFQGATIGLLRACKNYKPHTPASFQTFAYPHILGQMLEHGIYPESFFHIPDKVKVTLRDRSHPLHDTLHATKEHPRSIEEVVRKSQKPYREDIKLKDTIPDTKPQPWEEAAQHIRAERLHNALARLSPKLEKIVRELNGIQTPRRTLVEIGYDLGITKERTRQLHLQALKKLRPLYQKTWDLTA